MPHFVLFCAQMILVLCHHIYVLQSNYEKTWHSVLTILTVFSIVVQLAHEVIQMINQKKNYFKQPFNILQTTTIVLNLLCIGFGIFSE